MLSEIYCWTSRQLSPKLISCRWRMYGTIYLHSLGQPLHGFCLRLHVDVGDNKNALTTGDCRRDDRQLVARLNRCSLPRRSSVVYTRGDCRDECRDDRRRDDCSDSRGDERPRLLRATA